MSRARERAKGPSPEKEKTMSDDELTIEITQDDVVTILDITHEYLELISTFHL